MARIFFALYIILFGSVHANVCPDERSLYDYFCLTPEMAPNSVVQESDLYLIGARILSLYAHEVSKLGRPIILDAKWNSPYMGAGAVKKNDRFEIMVLGGTVRVDGFSKEAYATIICHELGHIIGGAPYQDFAGTEWSSREGQADYFAASQCLPRYYRSLGHSEASILDKIEQGGYDFLASMMSFSSATREQSLERVFVPMAPVETTLRGYPSLQCRYETFRNPQQRSSCWFKN